MNYTIEQETEDRQGVERIMQERLNDEQMQRAGLLGKLQGDLTLGGLKYPGEPYNSERRFEIYDLTVNAPEYNPAVSERDRKTIIHALNGHLRNRLGVTGTKTRSVLRAMDPSELLDYWKRVCTTIEGSEYFTIPVKDPNEIP